MKRLELIASESMQQDLLEALESALPGIEYTLVPGARGKGRRARREGTNVWPEENFVLFSYLEEAEAGLALAAVESVKSRFPAEGIAVFVLG